MNPSPADAEALFARAVELPVGARTDFVARHCAQSPELRREVESLLRAHDEAGGFLRTRAEQKQSSPVPATTALPRHTTVLNAAAYAETFLREPGPATDQRLNDYIATLPAALQREAANASKPLSASANCALGRNQFPPVTNHFRSRCPVSASNARWAKAVSASSMRHTMKNSTAASP